MFNCKAKMFIINNKNVKDNKFNDYILLCCLMYTIRADFQREFTFVNYSYTPKNRHAYEIRQP